MQERQFLSSHSGAHIFTDIDTTRYRRRGALALLVVASLVLMGAQLAAPLPARAAPGPIKQPGRASVTADALPTAQINGVVWTQLLVGNTVFAGGQFTSVRPAGATPGTRQSKRSNLMSYDIRTGVAKSFAPTFDGIVKALAVSPDQETLYVGGTFTRVNSKVRSRLAAFDISTGALKSMNPVVGSSVNALAVIDDVVYLGGDFNKVDGVSRPRLAAVDADDGDLLSWAPEADYGVRALVATPDESGVVAGGGFDTLNDERAPGMGLLDASTGETLRWAVNRVVKNSGTKAAIFSLAADDSTVYGSGYAYGGGNFEGVFAADPDEGEIEWLQDCHGDTYSVAPIGSVVYSASHAHYCRNIGGFSDTSPRTAWYYALAATTQATGTVAKNGQKGAHYGDFEDEPAPSLYNWFPSFTAGTVTGQHQAAWSVVGNSDYVSYAGEFPKVNGTAQQGLVRFARRELAPKKQGPRVSGADSAPTATPQRRSIKLSWTANWDRDDQTLSYDLLRNNVVIKTVSGVSQFWNRPTLTYTDSSGRADADYSYRIRVRDPDGNYLTSPSVSAVFPSEVAYAQQMTADGATHQWRLGSDPGQSKTPDAVGGLPMNVQSGVTFGVDGALSADSDTAATFTGSARTGSTSGTGGAVSVEGWFRTTGRSSGALISFGPSSQSAPAAAGSRQVYLSAGGQVVLAERPGGTAKVVSATSRSSYDDGRWHQVVAVHSSSKVELYVDGSRVASLASSVAVPASKGVWSLGGVTAPDLPGASGKSFQGSLDDVTVFGTALTLRQVRDHYLVAQPGVDVVDVSPRRR